MALIIFVINICIILFYDAYVSVVVDNPGVMVYITYKGSLVFSTIEHPVFVLIIGMTYICVPDLESVCRAQYILKSARIIFVFCSLLN